MSLQKIWSRLSTGMIHPNCGNVRFGSRPAAMAALQKRGRAGTGLHALFRKSGNDYQYASFRYWATLSWVTVTVGSMLIFFGGLVPMRICLAITTARPPIVGKYDIEAP